MAAATVTNKLLRFSPPFIKYNYRSLSSGGGNTAKLYIIYYSMHGHTHRMAEEIMKGASTVEGVQTSMFQVPEILPPEILKLAKAPSRNTSIPTIKTQQLTEADGFVFGFPTRYGMMCSQFKAFLDGTGGLWIRQALAGKPAGLFVSTGSQGGGQETTLLTAVTQLTHHGMIFVPTGYTSGAGMFNMSEAKGGSPYGAGCLAGDDTRKPSKVELEHAMHQGKLLAAVTKKLKV